MNAIVQWIFRDLGTFSFTIIGVVAALIVLAIVVNHFETRGPK